MSLAALTATYTDSEDEDENVANIVFEQPSPDESTSDSLIKSHPSRLVSYGEPGEDEEEKADSSLNNTDDLMDITNNDVTARLSRKPDVQSDESASNEAYDDKYDIKLPPPARGECSSQLQEKIAKLYEKKLRSNFNTIYSIQSRKDFRNPSIYEKLISYCGIDELGTNYPPELYDSHIWDSKSYYEELGKAQKAVMDKREKDKKAKVEFVSGTAKKATPETPAEDSKKRKSKWDVVSGTSVTKPEAVVPTFVPLVNSASGNKATVISAFGTISKKSK